MAAWSSFLHAGYQQYSFLSKNPGTLKRSNQIGLIYGATANYRLFFDIISAGYVDSDYGSILHFTTGTNCGELGSRAPAIWFWPGTTQLHVVIGDNSNSNWLDDLKTTAGSDCIYCYATYPSFLWTRQSHCLCWKSF